MTDLYTNQTPAAVKNATGVHLITESTPNGKKVQILLEELKDVYGTTWTTSLLDLETDEQNEEWFLRLNPNARIPILIDNTQTPPFPVIESSAELLYLVDKFDKDRIFSFDNLGEQSEVIQWLFFWQASGQPFQSQNNHFKKSAPEKIAYAIDRFHTQTLHVYSVIEAHLSVKYTSTHRVFLAGVAPGKYSIADMGMWPWVRSWKAAQFSVEEMDRFPCLLEWLARIDARPAVRRGISDMYDSEVNISLRVSSK